MPQMIDCPECGATLRVKDELLGKQVRCPSCSTIVQTEKPGAAPKKPKALSKRDDDEDTDDIPVKARSKKRLAELEEESGPPKWMVPAIIAGTVLVLVVVLGLLAYIVFGTNLLTPATRPKPTAAPPTEPATPATQPTPPTAPPTAPEPPVENWARKFIPGTKISVEIPEGSLPGDLGQALAGLGGGGITGFQSGLTGPMVFAASLLSDLVVEEVDPIAGIAAGVENDPNSKVLHKYDFLGRPALMVLQKGAGLPTIQLYLQNGKQTITLTIAGLGVNETMPVVKRFFSSIKFEQ